MIMKCLKKVTGFTIILFPIRLLLSSKGPKQADGCKLASMQTVGNCKRGLTKGLPSSA